MRKNVLPRAIALMMVSLAAGSLHAQSSVTLYGNIDGALDNVHKGQGDISGTLFQVLPQSLINSGNSTLQQQGAAIAAFYNGAYANRATLTRVSPSIISQNALGIKGSEDLGGGYKTGFVLEGQFATDTGAQNGQDSRMWGRQAYVGLTTPGGEVRVGRQYAPIFYSFAFTTVEAIGASDIMASGLVVNNLQVRQDNQVSYWLKTGSLTAAVSYSPNAGVDRYVSVLRGQPAGANTGQIIGGATAGNETAGSGGRGQTYGLFLNYMIEPQWLATFGYHANKFGDAQLVLPFASAQPTVLFSMDKYVGYALGTKYTVPGLGTNIAGIFHYGKFTNDAGSAEGPKVETFALGVKHPINQFAVGAEFAYGKFTNFTKGKDSALMLAGDYNFSKRTTVYIRAGYLKDSRGNLVSTDQPGLQIAGGPAPLLFGLGSTEIPFFAGGGINIDATTRVVAVGIRHQF